MKTKEQHSILVVDDNEQALSLVKDALTTRGYTVSVTPKGSEAMQTMESAEGDGFSLVIVDLVMPDMDGMELASKIATRWPEKKILVMSGYADDVVVHGVLEGANVDFLAKPFSIRDLFSRVEALLK